MDTSILICVFVYRIITVICGLAFAFLGFRLFYLGISEKAGELEATFGDKGLILRQFAPGIYFALFGTIIVGISLYRGVDILIENSLRGSLSLPGNPQSKPAADDTGGGNKLPTNNENIGMIVGTVPQLKMVNIPIRLLSIIDKLRNEGEDSLDDEERQVLDAWVENLHSKVRILADPPIDKGL